MLFQSDSALYITWKSLNFFRAAKSALNWTALIFSWIQDDVIQFNIIFFGIFRSTSMSRHIILIFSPYCWKEVNDIEVFVLPFYGPKISNEIKFLLFMLLKWKLIWFKFSEAFYRLVEWTFKIVAENLSFWCISAENWKNIYFKDLECHFVNYFMRFDLSDYDVTQFDILIHVCWYLSWFRVNQSWIGAAQRWKRNVLEQRKSALISTH